jgi:hypothetical protein
MPITIIQDDALVNPFVYTPGIITALEASLSPERFTTYVQAAGGDKEQALRLYVWNAMISAAFYTPLQGLEVALRNAIHRELSRAYGIQWYDQPTLGLAPAALRQVSDAKDTLQKSRKPLDPPRIVAELSWGFWVSLLGRGPRGRYETTLWRPALYRAFPHVRSLRKHVHAPRDYLRVFRNRIAHHEPIFARHLAADYASIIKVITWICPDTAAWIDHHNVVQATLAERPPIP